MKKLQYTLIELLAAMSIFIIMMGILFKTFTASADVAAAETTRLGIMTDVNVFFQYLTSDVKAMSIDIIAAPENDSGNRAQLHTNDTASAEDFSIKELSVSSTSIGFYSDVTPYNTGDFDTNADGIPDISPFVQYTYNAGDKTISRKHFTRDPNSSVTTPALAPTYSEEPIILEGVEEFTINVWDDYPGGQEIRSFPSATKPACITFTVTLTSPNPYASDAIKERAKRTISKTLYLNR